MKKIAFYIGNLQIGGAQRVMTNLANYFVQAGYAVDLITTYQGDHEFPFDDRVKRIVSGITADKLGKSRFRNFWKRFFRVRGIWKQERPDIIVSFMGKTNLLAIMTSRGMHIPVVVGVRSAPEREYAGRLMSLMVKLCFPLAAGIVLQTDDSVKYFSKSLQKKTKVLPNSLNPKYLKERYEGTRRNEIVQVGALDRNKNNALLLRAFAAICQNYPEMKVVLYGDGSSRAELEQLAEELGIGEQVVFAGKTYDVQDQIDKSRIYVLTSHVEGMPNALIEAMSLGLAVIATDCPCGGPRMLIRSRENGILIPVNDETALSQALCDILNDAALEEKLGKEAYKLQKQVHPDHVNHMWEAYLNEKMR